jgi:hypothetical protein
MASATNTNPVLEHLEDGKTYDLDFGDTWNTVNDGNTSKYAYHTIKCNLKTIHFRFLYIFYVLKMILNQHRLLNLNKRS